MARSDDIDAGPGHLLTAATLPYAATVPDSTPMAPPLAALLDMAMAAHLPEVLPPRCAAL
jgi:hypothetical protein